MYAVVRTGGKQYRIEAGQTITVDRLDLEPGQSVDLEVLALSDGERVRVGTPALEGVTVIAEVTAHRAGEKIDVLRYKSKVRHRKRMGHRRLITELRVTKLPEMQD